ncbi:MAG: leucine-rich repeat domain-containing protein, partial [Clostridia bacterium]|nr:leucine-rich repeat domain-containing protein [Clostridia bacterium]
MKRTEFTGGKYTYVLLDGGTAEIIKYNGNAETLEIPAELDGKRVTRIGNDAFAWCGSLTSVAIPDSVTRIGDSAFALCSSLTSVTIPDSVTDIGANPFTSCEALTGFRVSPDHPALAVIDGVLFSKADRRLVSCPKGLDSDAYTIPQGTEIIGVSAFEFCSSLASVAIPGSVTRIGDSAFLGCDGLTSIAIPDSVTEIGKYAFSFCGSLASLAIPGSVTRIGDFAFDACSGLTSIAIPDSVKEIGANPFCWCDALAGLRVSPDHPALAVIGGVLFSKADRRLVSYPAGSASNAYTVPQGIEIIGDFAFSYCGGLTSIAIPGSVTEIGEDAFSNCDWLTLTVGRDSFAKEYCVA